MELFEGMLEKDKNEFRRVCSHLMASCFLCKKNEKTKSEYYFVMRHREVFERYLDVLGLSVEVNEEYGVVQLTGPGGTGHVRLRMNDSIILLILRILFDEKKRELSAGDVVVNVGDIQEKYLSLKIRDRQIDKTTLNNALRLLARYNLVTLLDKDAHEEDSRILIYDSILMAVRVDDIRRVHEMVLRYRKGEESDETPDEDTAD